MQLFMLSDAQQHGSLDKQAKTQQDLVMLCTGNVPSVLLLDGRSWLNFLADVEQGHDWCELGVFPCRVTFAKGPFAERYGTQDGLTPGARAPRPPRGDSLATLGQLI